MSKKPSPKKTDQLLSSKITSVALCAMATTLVVMVAFKVLTPHTSSLVTKQEPLIVLADSEQEYLFDENYGGGNDETRVIHILSQQRNAQKHRIQDLNSELASTKALVQKMKTQMMVAGGNHERKLKKHADDLAAQVKRGETVASNYKSEIIERDALLARQRQEFENITRMLGETNQSIQEQLRAMEKELNAEKERNQQLVAARSGDQEKVDELNQKLNDSLATIQMMGNELGFARDQIYALEEAGNQQLLAANQELLNHQQQLDLLQEENRALNIELAQLHEQITSANNAVVEEETLIAMGDEEEPIATYTSAELQKQITQLEEANQRQCDLIEVLTVEMATANARALNSGVVESSQVMNEMQAELANYERLLDQARQQLASLSEENGHIEDRQQYAVEELNSTVRALQEENEQLLSRNKELRGFLGSAHQDIQELAYLERENIEYQRQLEEVQQTPAVGELKSQLAELSNRYTMEQKKSQRLEMELNTSNQVLAALQEEIASSENRQNSHSPISQARHSKYNSSINKFKSKVAQLTTRLAQEMKKTSAAEERLEEAQQRYRNLADQNSELARKQQDTDQRNYVEEIAALEKELASERDTNRRTQRQLEMVKATPGEYENLLAAEEELRQHKVALISLQHEFNLLANEYTDLEAANNSLVASYERTIEEFNALLSEEQTKTKMLIGDLEMLHEQYQAEIAQDNG